MKYKGFYIRIVPDKEIKRVDKKGRDVLCEGLFIHYYGSTFSIVNSTAFFTVELTFGIHCFLNSSH